jgi:hypothetical protein
MDGFPDRWLSPVLFTPLLAAEVRAMNGDCDTFAAGIVGECRLRFGSET